MGWICVVIILIVCSSISTGSSDGNRFSLKMPNVIPLKPDSYMCTQMRLGETKYIVGYSPEADMHIAHHMLLFKCSDVYTKSKTYACMAPCIGSEVIYAWARQAPELNLPKGVAFEVGPLTGFPYLVLQVHYLKRLSTSDSSGVSIHTVAKPQLGIAGVMLMSYSGEKPIPPKSRDVRMYYGCIHESRTRIYPFAFRVHAHSLGRTIFAYHFSHKNWSSGNLVGRASPQWPQAFYNSSSFKPIEKDDVIIGSCVFDSMDRKHVTHIGSTHVDEMCNFYLMYYQKRTDTPLSSYQLEFCGDGVDMEKKTFERLIKSVPDRIFDYLPTSRQKKSKTKGYSISYHSVASKLNSLTELGQVSGVSIDSEGLLYIFHRADRVWDRTTFDENEKLKKAYRRRPIKADTIVIVDRNSGNVVDRFGADMFHMPHGIHVDSKGDVWVTDVGLHQVMKFKKSVWDKPALILGVAFEPGDDDKHFCKPADVLPFGNEDVYVADGYCNSRIMKFSRTGQLVSKLYSREGKFVVPHSLTRLDNSRLCVADRERARIECFSAASGKSVILLKGIPEFGSAVYAITAGDARGDDIHGVTMRDDDSPKGFTYSISKDEVVSRWGAHLKRPHDVVHFKNFLYVGDLSPLYGIAVFKQDNEPGHVAEKQNSVAKKGKEVVVILTNLSTQRTLLANETAYESKGFMELLSSNVPFLVGVIIVLPLAIIVFGAVIVRLYKTRMCLFCCRRRVPRLRINKERGRFEPLLNDNESDSDEHDDILNITKMKTPDRTA